MLDPAIADFAKSLFSAIAAGLVLMVVRSVNAGIRRAKERFDHLAVELRHTQKALHVEPFYPEDV